MQIEARSKHDRTVHVDHGVTRELLLIALVVALGVLAAVALILPGIVTA